jgi:hypothetical protein
MVGQYVEIVRVSEYKFVYLSNGDKLFYTDRGRCPIGWCAEYKRSGYTQRLGVYTYKEAVECYEEHTGNCIIGVLDEEGVEHILNTPELNWVLPQQKKAA